MNNDKFADLLAEAKNKDTLSAEQTADLWEAGDPCGDKGCTKAVKRRDHPRGESEVPRHPDAPETEFVCIHHGIVAKR